MRADAGERFVDVAPASSAVAGRAWVCEEDGEIPTYLLYEVVDGAAVVVTQA